MARAGSNKWQGGTDFTLVGKCRRGVLAGKRHLQRAARIAVGLGGGEQHRGVAAEQPTVNAKRLQ